MKQYVSFQRLDIICSIQCLTEFYLKRFLPDLLLIQLGGFRKGGKFSVCEYTHGIAVLHRVGKVMQNHHDRPALLRKALQEAGFPQVPILTLSSGSLNKQQN